MQVTGEKSARDTAGRFSVRAAIGTSVATLLAFGVAVSTPPLSGPFCREGCVGYPYLDVAARFPRDYYWMFPAIVATAFYVALMVALRERAAAVHREMATLSLVCAAVAATVLVADYFLQLAVIQPSILAGERDGIALLSQYNPHGVFIALEELGYLLMSLSLAGMALVVESSTRPGRIVRWLFVGALAVNSTVLGVIALRLGHDRAYLFEVIVIAVNWSVLSVAGFLLAILFKRAAPDGER